MSHFLNSRHHSGHYICEADNGFGNSPVAKEVRLEVHRKFIFCHFAGNLLWTWFYSSFLCDAIYNYFPFFQMLLMLKLSVVSCSLGREIIFICHYFRNEYWTHDVKDLRRFKELTFQIWKRGEASLHCSQFSKGCCHLDKVGEIFSLFMWPRREKWKWNCCHMWTR